MRTRLIAALVVLAVVVGVMLLANAGGGGGGSTTTAPSTTVAAPTVAPTTSTGPPPTIEPTTTTTTTTQPPATTAAPTTVPKPTPPAGCYLIDDARGVLLVLDADGEERDVGAILDAGGDPPLGGSREEPSQLEALAHDPESGRYFVASWDLLGTLDPETAEFEEVGDTGLGDLDGLAFDAEGTLYGVARVDGGPDRLVVIDPATADAEDIGPIAGPGVLADVDDLAFEPGSGDLYAITNREGTAERTSVLVVVDPADASAAAVGGDMGVADAEGSTFQSDGRLWVTTGRRGSSALFLVDTATGAAEGVAVLGDGIGDYEAIACPNGET